MSEIGLQFTFLYCLHMLLLLFLESSIILSSKIYILLSFSATGLYGRIQI